MWQIKSITVPSGYTYNILGGIGTNIAQHNTGDVFGPQGAVYFISVPGLGTMFLEDVGNDGHPTWAVQVNGLNTYWLYYGGGQVSITINIDGSFYLTDGGSNTVQGQLIANMQDVGKLTKKILMTVQGAPSFQPAWNANPMDTMFRMGFPRTCMFNMDANCCGQYMAIINSVRFPSGDALTAEELTGWFSCILCKTATGAVVGAFSVIIIAMIVYTGGEAIVAALEASTTVEAIAAALGISVEALVPLIVRAFAIGGVTGFVSALTDLICADFCSSCIDVKATTLV